jgi:hypothetical protein
LPTQVRDFDSNERGSLAPLGIGLAMLSLTLVLGILAAASLYLTERRLTTVAESTALAVLIDAKGNLAQPLTPLASRWLGSQPLAPIASRWLGSQPLRGLFQVELVEVSSIDQRSVRVRLCSNSKPIFENYMFSEIGRVCSEALARRGR